MKFVNILLLAMALIAGGLTAPALAGDMGPQWSHHVLQLLCHQDLSSADIRRAVDHLRTAVGQPTLPAPHP